MSFCAVVYRRGAYQRAGAWCWRAIAAGELPASDLERLVMDDGELLARVHRIITDRGMRHELRPPDERFVGRVTRTVDQAFCPAAAAIIERGAELLRKEVTTRPAPRLSLTYGN